MDEESLYDEYLDLLVADPTGPEVAAPADFLQRRNVTPESVPELLASLERLYASRGPTLSPSAPSIAVASSAIGDFRLLERLGEGGMGVVWMAEQISLGRRVALKVIRSEVANSLTANTRFDREARAIAKLSHPGIVRIFSVGGGKDDTPGGAGGTLRYIAMEYVPGRGLDETLADAKRSGAPLAPKVVARWGSQIARALHAAHEQNIIHRDVKPSNIRIAAGAAGSPSHSGSPTASGPQPGRAMLLDFGLARDLGDTTAGTTLTQAFVGTPDYAAPEQVGRGGGILDARTDVYSLGAVLYEALTGVTPTRGESLEQVLVSILTDEPIEPVKLVPGLPRDLSIVVMKAMRKDPARRYQSAAALADDLDAILELRPISARPPGAGERLLRWTSRNRALTAVLATASFSLLAVGGLLVAQRLAASTARREECDRTLAEAWKLRDEYRRDRETLRDNEARFVDLVNSRDGGYFTPEQDRAFNTLEAAVDRARLGRELTFHKGLDLAGRAERLGAEPAEVQRLKASMYLERYLEAELRDDPEGREIFRDFVRQHDPDGAVLDKLRGATSLRFVNAPPAAELHIFRRQLASRIDVKAEPRLVPVPFRASPRWRPPTDMPGDWTLRVTRGAGDLREGDQILSIGGRGFASLACEQAEALAAPGAPAVVWSGGHGRRLTLPDGLQVRLTAAPRYLGPESRVTDRELAQGVSLDAEPYILEMRAPGYERRVVVLRPSRDATWTQDCSMRPLGTTPDGWIQVSATSSSPDPRRPFWIMEREVTVADFFDFLNHADTQARIAADPSLKWEPRDSETAQGQRDAEGRFLIPHDWDPRWPVIFVTRHAALAYADWMTRTRGQGRWTYTLPSEDQWVEASAAVGGERYVWGSRFRPKWTSSCFAKPTPSPDPVRSFPIDESVLGVYDLGGSASEWTTRVWIPGQAYFRHAGGAWGTGLPEAFQVYGGNGALSESRGGMIGFRLVMTAAESMPAPAQKDSR